MFDKFGEFDSAEELNRAAAAQRDEGDEEEGGMVIGRSSVCGQQRLARYTVSAKEVKVPRDRRAGAMV